MRSWHYLICAGFAACLSIALVSRGEDKTPAAKSSSDSKEMNCVACDKTTSCAQLDAIKKLAGTWVSDEKGMDGKPMTLEFKVTAAGSAVQETMFPGANHEMVNFYHMDGDRLLVTHYCAMGIQPRMALTSADKGVLKFEFVDCTNLKSRDSAHMDSLQMTLDGDKLVEKWTSFANGKATESVEFALKRKPA